MAGRLKYVWKERPDGWRVHVYARSTGKKVGAYDLPRRDLSLLADRLDAPDALKARAEAERSERTTGTFAELVDDYQSIDECDAYAELSQTTRDNYDLYLAEMRKKFGAMPLLALEAPRVRLRFERWRDEARGAPRYADMRITVLNNVLNEGVRSFKIPKNHASGITRLYKGKDEIRIWTPDDIERFRAAAPAHVWRVFEIGVHTGARVSAILALSPANIDGDWLVFDPLKRGATVQLPLNKMPPLKASIEALPKDGLRLLLSSRKRPWTRQGFKSSFSRARAKAKLGHLRFHDLRGTAITRWLRDLPPHKVALFTGHSLEYVTKIADSHYFARSRENVLDAADWLDYSGTAGEPAGTTEGTTASKVTALKKR